MTKIVARAMNPMELKAHLIEAFSATTNDPHVLPLKQERIFSTIYQGCLNELMQAD
jgi:hypothetical protein